jgi:hypothetical protein
VVREKPDRHVTGGRLGERRPAASSSAASAPRKPSFDATNWSNTSRGDSARMPSTINGGCAAGSKVASKRVGAPASPAFTDVSQNVDRDEMRDHVLDRPTGAAARRSPLVVGQAGEQRLHPPALTGDRRELVVGWDRRT